jgi:hypothetical protein
MGPPLIYQEGVGLVPGNLRSLPFLTDLPEKIREFIYGGTHFDRVTTTNKTVLSRYQFNSRVCSQLLPSQQRGE